VRPLLALAASVLVLVAAAPAGAAWSPAVNMPGTASADPNTGTVVVEFSNAVQGVALVTLNNNVSALRTTDGGASWQSGSPAGGEYTMAVDHDAAGNRVYVWNSTSGGGVRALRTGPDGLPNASGAVTVPGAVSNSTNSDVDVAVNLAGDALIAWSDNSSGVSGVAFWPAGAAQPNGPHTFTPPTAASAGEVNAFLDPNRSGVLLFQRNTTLLQALSANANFPGNPFGDPVTLVDGVAGRAAAQAPDGRAVLAVAKVRDLAGGPPTFTQELFVAGRAAPDPFTGLTEIDGDDTHFVRQFLGADINANGQAIVGYNLVPNVPATTCANLLGQHLAKVAVGNVSASGGISLGPQTISESGRDAFSPAVAIGPDGRTAAAWNQFDDCGPQGNGQNRNRSTAAAYAGAGVPALIDDPPGVAAALAFRADGELLGVLGGSFTGASALKSSVYGTGNVLEPPGNGPGPGPGPGGGASSFGPETKLTLVLGAASIKANQPVSVVVDNDNSFTVSGSVSGETTKAVATAAAKKKSKKKKVKLKARSFSVPAGGRTTVKLKLPKPLKKLLKRSKKLSLAITASVRDPAGNERTVKKTLKPKLKAKKKKGRKK
jgi:hypothetical protein